LVAQTSTNIEQELKYARIPIKVAKDGTFRFAGLPGRDYVVQVQGPYDPVSIYVTLPDRGQTTLLNGEIATFLLPPPDHVSVVTPAGYGPFTLKSVKLTEIPAGSWAPQTPIDYITDDEVHDLPKHPAGQVTLALHGTDDVWISRLEHHGDTTYCLTRMPKGWYMGWFRVYNGILASYWGADHAGDVPCGATRGVAGQLLRCSLSPGNYVLGIGQYGVHNAILNTLNLNAPGSQDSFRVYAFEVD
jgi:hypothetical protein